MKKKKIYLIVAFAFFACLFFNNISAKAESNDSIMMGTYIKTVPVNKTIKVYVQENLKDYLEENGITVYSENRGGWWFIKDYYYIANKYVDRIVETRSIKNDVDSLRFMVNELEDEAKKINSNQYKNIVLGYIRTIDKKYTDGYFGHWSMVAGIHNEDDINKIKKLEDEKIGLRFYEYFAQFLCYTDNHGQYIVSSYNSDLHGEVREQFKNKENNPIKLKDPASKTKGIDAIHLFASIDGIYCKTQASPVQLGNNRMERDIVSWNGDLQQAARKIYEKMLENPPILSNDDLLKPHNQKMNLLFNGDYECTEDDILADVDAMNMTKLFVDHDNTTIATALSGYYELINNNEKKRYKTFIKTVLLDEEKNTSIKNKSEIERFELEVANQFNIKIEINNGNKNYFNHSYYVAKTFVGFAIMRDGDYTSVKFFGELPPEEIRAFVVKSFIEFVEDYLY